MRFYCIHFVLVSAVTLQGCWPTRRYTENGCHIASKSLYCLCNTNMCNNITLVSKNIVSWIRLQPNRRKRLFTNKTKDVLISRVTSMLCNNSNEYKTKEMLISRVTSMLYNNNNTHREMLILTATSQLPNNSEDPLNRKPVSLFNPLLNSLQNKRILKERTISVSEYELLTDIYTHDVHRTFRQRWRRNANKLNVSYVPMCGAIVRVGALLAAAPRYRSKGM